MPFNDLIRQRTQAFANSLNSHRLLVYSLISVIAVSAVIANALKNYSNFYSVAISLSKSSRSVLALANFGFLLALLCGYIVQRIFFGTLRPNEVERLYDRLWFFITESLLAFTIFRDEFDIPFALMFGFLLFVKSFHWLAADRIEWMDQIPYPGPPPVFHLRMSLLFVILCITDFLLFLFAVGDTITNGVGGMVLFASEYGILMASVLNAVSKYVLSAYELRRAGQRGGENAPPWESKSMWVFYIELATDFLKLSTYLVFFTIIITFYGLPLNIVRDVYITARSFISRLRAFHRYQTATRNMDQRYPNATEEEMSAMSDRTCIICREDMVLHEVQGQAPVHSDGPNTTPKKLPCGHIFHFYCLRSWLERQQSCPTCRRTVLEVNPPGQEAVNGAPVAPAPVPVPQQPNPFGIPAAQNQIPQGVNNPLGNPLGLMGRLFGPPAQVQAPQNQIHLPQHPGHLAGPQEVVIQYHIQYQLARDQQPQPQNPPQRLEPVPRFPGFHGPGGVWQQWPAALQENGNVPHNIPAQQETVLPATSPAAPATATQQVGPPTPPSAEHDRPVNSESNASLSPRDAAAVAAMRRSNSLNRGSGTRHDTANDTLPSDSPRPPNATSRSPATNGIQQPAGIPNLIPLYDYGANIANSGLNGATQSYRPPGGMRTQAPPGTQFPQPDTTQNYTRATPSRGPSDPRLQQRNSSQPPISHLPPSLTDEQLAIMDRVTREAIDERLRVLEGVSGAVYRCIDDLMRMRSALPSPAPISAPHPSSPIPPHHTAVPSTSEGPRTPNADDPHPSGSAPSVVDGSRTSESESTPPVPNTKDGKSADTLNNPSDAAGTAEQGE